MNGGEAPRRLAIVTGASRGLGEVIAEYLAGAGFDLIITARGEQALEAAATRFRQFGVSVRPLPGAVESPGHRAQLAEAVRARGALHILVNNASELGEGALPPLVTYPLPAWRRVLEVNLLAPVALVQDLAPYLRAGAGLVVNLSSDAAVGAYPGWGAYGASKAALDLASRTLAAELATSGVTVVSVDPGDMRTAMHQSAFPHQDISDRPLPGATLPFWVWLFGQPPRSVNGARLRAQAERWEVAA